MEEPLVTEKTAYADAGFAVLKEEDGILVRMQYPKLGMKNAEQGCFLRQGAYERLAEAQKRMPRGYHIAVWDAWRPFSLQKELFDSYYQSIVETFGIADEPENVKLDTVRKYVSIPHRLEYEYPVHTSGGAVDITLVDEAGHDIPMGTRFDEMVPAAQTDYFENTDNEEVIRNRRLLYHVMISCGFTNLPSEWWHYDYGDRFWAYYTGKPILYGPVYEKEGIKIA